MVQGVNLRSRGVKRGKFFVECVTTAGALAADRATVLVPVLVAEGFFAAVFIADIIRLRPGDQGWLSGKIHLNVEMHSIAFSALFFWLIPTVLLAGLIGISQTEKAIPRILMRFRRDMKGRDVELELPNLNSDKFDPEQRWHHGMYSWSSLVTVRERWNTVRGRRTAELDYLRGVGRLSIWQWSRSPILICWPMIYTVLPILLVGADVATGIIIS